MHESRGNSNIREVFGSWLDHAILFTMQKQHEGPFLSHGRTKVVLQLTENC